MQSNSPSSVPNLNVSEAPTLEAPEAEEASATASPFTYNLTKSSLVL